MSFDWSEIPSHVKVIAVSKLQPVEKIVALHEQRDHVDFAENYVQEALQKVEALKHLPLKWHLIGSLQSNKVKFLQDHFCLIHAVDSFRLAQKISVAALEKNHRQKVLLQINVANENSKGGFSVEEFQNVCKELQNLAGLQIEGLMTMPPLQDNPEVNRPYFRALAQLGKQLCQLFPGATELSMGTSSDYRIAIEEGATMVRLGSVLFGERSRGAQ